MGRDIQINLIFDTDNAITPYVHNSDDKGAGQGNKVLRYDFRVHDTTKAQERYHAWLEATFKTPAGKVLQKIEVGPQPPFNPVSAKNTTRWSFAGEVQPLGFMGTIDLKFYKAASSSQRAASDTVLFEDTKKLGHFIEPTAKASGTPGEKKVPDVKTKPWNVYIIDKYPKGAVGAAHGHPHWGDKSTKWPDLDTAGVVTKLLQAWMGRIATVADPAYRANVEWATGKPSKKLQPNELFVNLLSSGSSSHDAASRKALLAAKAGGGTILKDEKKRTVLCEVWPDTIDTGRNQDTLPMEVAKLIFHEWMHFKLDVDVDIEVDTSADIHSRSPKSLGNPAPASAGNVDVPVDSIFFDGPTDEDVESMALNLEKTFTFFGGL